MTDVKEQWVCIKFCFKLGNTEVETHRMLNPSALGHLNPSSYCDVGRFFYRVFKF